MKKPFSRIFIIFIIQYMSSVDFYNSLIGEFKEHVMIHSNGVIFFNTGHLMFWVISL